MSQRDRQYSVLEYDKVLALLEERTTSRKGAEEATALKPVTNLRVIRERLTETTEAVSVIMRKGAMPLGEFGDVTQAVAHGEKGGFLTMGQLLEVGRHLSIARKAKEFLKEDEPATPLLTTITSALESFRALEERIQESILSENEMADSASRDLHRIRRSMIAQNENIRSRLNQMVTGAACRDYLQDQIVTIRSGRYVVPVKQEHRQRFPGIVHDQSRGGDTLFIEPQAVVEMNNRLREMEIEEQREVERILAAFSAEVAEIGSDIRLNQELLTRLDLIFAKGKLSADMKATEAEINEDGQVEIRNGRHPLIDPSKVVPVSLSLGKGYRSLIVTGPNTGGKTVTLKTVGLFILMTEAGLHVPASSANLHMARKVYADIGDEQSIEQSLSTFSAHMKNIVYIMKFALASDIVFLDELGAGTDPTEGAALAISILETLRGRDCLVMATTHYTELKKYAMATEGVENASMEFDLETLSPTYRLMLGTPGRSNAFEISRKLGLSGAIVSRATELLDSGAVAFETVIEQVHEERQRAEADRDEALRLKLGIQKQKDTLDAQQVDFEEKRDKILEKAREEALSMIGEAEEYAILVRDEIKTLLAETKEIATGSGSGAKPGNTRGDVYRKLDESRKLLRQLDGQYRRAVRGRRKDAAAEADLPLPAPDDLKPGDLVRLIRMDQTGEVLSSPDDRGEVQVQVGRIRMTIPLRDLRLLPREGKGGRGRKTGSGSHYAGVIRSKITTVSSSLDVHGENLDDAEHRVDKYLDDAFLAGLGEVAIVHGRGEGILREGLRRMLKRHRHVKKIRPGGPGEGGEGATIVTLRT